MVLYLRYLVKREIVSSSWQYLYSFSIIVSHQITLWSFRGKLIIINKHVTISVQMWLIFQIWAHEFWMKCFKIWQSATFHLDIAEMAFSVKLLGDSATSFPDALQLAEIESINFKKWIGFSQTYSGNWVLKYGLESSLKDRLSSDRVAVDLRKSINRKILSKKILEPIKPSSIQWSNNLVSSSCFIKIFLVSAVSDLNVNKNHVTLRISVFYKRIEKFNWKFAVVFPKKKANSFSLSLSLELRLESWAFFLASR